MNIPGSIEAELKAAREEGRRESLMEAIAHCGSKYNECLREGAAARAHGQTVLQETMFRRAVVYMSIAIELRSKL